MECSCYNPGNALDLGAGLEERATLSSLSVLPHVCSKVPGCLKASHCACHCDAGVGNEAVGIFTHLYIKILLTVPGDHRLSMNKPLMSS